ncbi:STAS domain-containing protein [Embleya sp. NPDC056538]|uniref:STAS domain-containing protein n=1 Tax=Embleya sp. NPDC056538 TaxID=3345858 RepID=UPI0036AF2A92
MSGTCGERRRRLHRARSAPTGAGGRRRRGPQEARKAVGQPQSASTRILDGRVVVTLHGEIDIANLPAVERELARLEHVHAGDVYVDLRAVTFLDVRVVGELVRARDHADRRDTPMRLVCLRPFTLRLLEMVGGFAVVDGLPGPAD